MANKDTISFLSKCTNWKIITKEEYKNGISRKAKNDAKWMEIKKKANKNKSEDKFKQVVYYPIKQKAKEMVTYVDKDINQKRLNSINCNKKNPNNSIFSIGDYNHNIMTLSQLNFYGAQVRHTPKTFFDWDDGKRYIPKYKKDV